MRKLSQINEGMWKSGLDRAKNNTVRQEDRLPNTNLYDLKGVDFGFPFLIADQIFKKDNETTFTFRQIEEEFKPYLNEAGWRLMTLDEVKYFIENTIWQIALPEGTTTFDSCVKFLSKRNKSKIETSIKPSDLLRTPQFFFAVQQEDDVNFYRGLKLYKNLDGELKYEIFAHHPLTLLYVLLVKDKKVNEGMWKSGLDRAKNNELRIEDKIHSNIGEMKEIDLGDFCPFYVSDINLEIDEKEFITFNRYKEIKNQIEKTGWRMPKASEWRDYVLTHTRLNTHFPDDNVWTTELVSKYDEDIKIVLANDINKSLAIQFWLEYDAPESQKNFGLTYEIWLKNRFIPDPTWRYDFAGPENTSYMIRLVKDKK